MERRMLVEPCPSLSGALSRSTAAKGRRQKESNRKHNFAVSTFPAGRALPALQVPFLWQSEDGNRIVFRLRPVRRDLDRVTQTLPGSLDGSVRWRPRTHLTGL